MASPLARSSQELPLRPSPWRRFRPADPAGKTGTGLYVTPASAVAGVITTVQYRMLRLSSRTEEGSEEACGRGATR